MPYAVFSKRTGTVTRIIDQLTSVLPSESVLEVDDEINYPRGYLSEVEGQSANYQGFPLFQNEANTASTIQPYRVELDGVTGRPKVVRNNAIYTTPVNPGSGLPLTVWNDLPVTSHPFAWKIEELAAAKYESILARNAPFQVVIGEEFINTDHIDTAESTGYVLSEGQCFIAPGGALVTTEFQFRVDSQGVVDPTGTSDEDSRQFIFDTYFLTITPDMGSSIQTNWSGRKWSDGAMIGGGTPTWFKAIVDDAYPTTELGGAATTATALRGIILRFTNIGTETIALENYQMLLRIRNLVLLAS